MTLLDNTPLFYPEHRNHIWTYCIYLGPYSNDGRNYDLGIYIKPNSIVSAAICYGPEPSEYISGPIDCIGAWERLPYYCETYKRAMFLNLHPTMQGECVGGIEDLRKEYARLNNRVKKHLKHPEVVKLLNTQRIKIEKDFARFNIKLI